MKIRFLKYSALLPALVLLLASCSKNKSTISGNITNAKSETLFFEQLTATKINKLDSVKLDDKGDFKLEVTIPDYGFYRIRLADNSFITLLLDSTNTNIEITADALNMQKDYTVKGSPESEKIKELFTEMTKMFGKKDSINQLGNSLSQEGKLDPATDASLREGFFAIDNSIHEYLREVIKENEKSLLPLLAVEYFNPKENAADLVHIADLLNASYPNSDYVISYTARVNELKREVPVGSVAPEIIVNDPQGNSISLSQFRGKVVLIDFWASWCRPCRAENPNVVKLYQKYKNKGFEIFGVSLDQTKEAWLQAIAADNLSWKHGSELAFWNSSFVKTYKIEGIPNTVLVDTNGIIIAKNLTAQQLDLKLAEVLK